MAAQTIASACDWSSILEGDEVNMIAMHLDAPSLSSFAASCKAVRCHLKSANTLRWLADLRGLQSAGISSLEHLELAQVMADCSSSIFFGWGGMSVDPSAHPSLQKLAQLLARHTTLTLSIEAHCGLEALFAMPLPGQARAFTRQRARAVRNALYCQAHEVDVALDASRVVEKAWGCSRPLQWCFGQIVPQNMGLDVPFDTAGAAKNRRVELYLRCGDYEVPKRRKRSEIPHAPSEPPLEDIYRNSNGDIVEGATAADAPSLVLVLDDDDNDGTADMDPSPIAGVQQQMLMMAALMVNDDDDDSGSDNWPDSADEEVEEDWVANWDEDEEGGGEEGLQDVD
jgi:outer membrane protein OmpA-like peptidoglycan-associated protein